MASTTVSQDRPSTTSTQVNPLPNHRLPRRRGNLPPRKAKWSPADDATLVSVLKTQQAAGNQVANSWKGVVWVAAADALVGSELVSGGAPKKARACADRWATLKSQFISVQTLRRLSGFGWDDVEKRVTATKDDVWDTYSEVHPDASTWRTKPFPLYEAIHGLIDSTYAMGENGLRLNEMGDDGDDGSQNEDSLGDNHSCDMNDTDWPQSPSPEPPTPAVLGKRRQGSSNSLHPLPARKRGRVTWEGAMEQAAEALLSMASAPSLNSGTPSRRARAIRLLCSNQTLTEEEQVRAMQLIRKDIALADVYVAIESPALRAQYIRRELDET